MNKLIKMATIVAGVGAMLSFAGCGEQDPVKKVASTLREVRAELVSAGAASFADEAIPEKIIAELEAGTLSDGDKKEVMSMGEKAAAALPQFKKYMGVMKEMKGLDSYIFKEFFKPEQFLGSNSEEQAKLLEKAEKKLGQLKALKAAM